MSQPNPPLHVQAWLSGAPSTATVSVDSQPAQPAQLSPNPGWSSPSGGVVLDATVATGGGSSYAHTFKVQAGGSSANYSLAVAGDTTKLPQFDNNGNCTQDNTIGGTTTTYGWDAEDRLVSINNIANNSSTQFGYDGFGRRVSIVEKDNFGTVLKTSSFVWDGTALLQCRETFGTTIRVKTYYPEGMYVQDTTAGTTTTGSFFYERDHLGSIREMTDANQTIRARYTYDPYGRVSQNVGSNTNGVPLMDADFRFAGMYYHTNSHLHLTLFRAYDADTGRWLSRDPIGETGGVNLYRYVGNDPVNLSDPMGLYWIPVKNYHPNNGPWNRYDTAAVLSPVLVFDGIEVATAYGIETALMNTVAGLTMLWDFPDSPETQCPSLGMAAPNGGKGRQHGGSVHNKMIDNFIKNLPQGAKNIRKNQQQVDINGNSVGSNLPDVQYDLNGEHYNVEFDLNPLRSIEHFEKIFANDPTSPIELNF